ncbi:MAG: ABC transporter permease [Peptostreptococcaceae bacterium]|nr:ABC transporter permease [Peptostreptococcaceae bacterium]
MGTKLKHFVDSGAFNSFLSSFTAIIIGLVFGLIILLISNPSQAMAGFKVILMGGFSGGSKGIGDTLYFATPIILTGLSVAFAFKTGLFNIGAAGQFVVGSYFAVYTGIVFTGLGSLQWVFAILAGIIGGALWGLIPGILKAYRNVNEVIATIMMNYIGIYLVNMLVRDDTLLFDTLRNQSKLPHANAILPKMGLDKLFPGSSANGGFFIAILAVIVIYILLNKTTFGYELKAVGYNRDASRYAGINEKRSIILSMAIAGALAGLGGALLLLAGVGKHLEVVDILPAEGFNGIPVALLGMSHPVGVFLSALFISHMGRGGFYLQRLQFVPEIITIITAAIVYFSAFSLVVKDRITKIRKKISKDGSRPNANSEEPDDKNLVEEGQ